MTIPKIMKKFSIFLLGLFILSLALFAALSVKAVSEKSNLMERVIKSVKAGEEKKDVLPEFVFSFINSKTDFKGWVEINGKVKEAKSVEFYLKLPQSINDIYLGNAAADGDNWRFNLDTTKKPNGKYKLFAKIKNASGQYLSQEIDVSIKNPAEIDTGLGKKIEEELNKAKNEISEAEKKLSEAKKGIKDELSKNIEELVNKAKEIAGQKNKNKEISEVDKKIEEVVKNNNKTIDKLADDVQKTKELTENISQQKIEKNKVEQKISSLEKELAEISKKKEEAQKNNNIVQLEQAKILEQAKVKSIENYKEEKKKTEETIQAIDSQLKEAQEEKNKAKEKIINSRKEVIEVVAREAPPEKKAAVSEITKQVENITNANLGKLENEVISKEKIKAEGEKVLTKDSDSDGLSDVEEVRLKTDPFNPDSDGDGYLDGSEYVLGYNPLDPSPAGKIAYSDPREAVLQQKDVYKVERVEKIFDKSGRSGIKIEGKALPDSFVTVYIYSSLIVMTTKTDSNGNWTIVLDKPLSDGTHEVYAALTNNYGEIAARSELFVFTKIGDMVAAITISALSSGEKSSPASIFQNKIYIILAFVIILGIAASFFLVGVFSQNKPS